MSGGCGVNDQLDAARSALDAALERTNAARAAYRKLLPLNCTGARPLQLAMLERAVNELAEAERAEFLAARLVQAHLAGHAAADRSRAAS